MFIKKENCHNSEIYDNSLWKELINRQLYVTHPDCINESQISFLQNCMNENLSHARHTEIERLTFSSIFAALTAGGLSFITQNTQNMCILFITCVLMSVLSFINVLLTLRWNTCYRRYMYYAKQCYKTLRIILFKYNDSNIELKSRENIDDNFSKIKEYPIFCFNCVSNQPKFMSARLILNFFSFILFILWIIISLYVYFIK